jgi:hypothetical protein
MKRILLSALCALPAFCFGQTLLYNDGAMIKVQAGATLYVEGGIHNTATGTIDNEGTIEVKGNFLNQGTWQTDPNTLIFSGNTNSDVTPGTAVFQTVKVQKDATFNVNLLGHMTVNTNLDFNSPGSSKIITNNFDVKLGAAATASGADADEYVATTGTGMMEKAVTANNTFVFPVGDATNYSPLQSVYTGSGYAAANIRVKANDLTHPNKPADATEYISRYWDVNATGITGYANTITGTYIPADLTLGGGGVAAQVKGATYDGDWSYAGASSGVNTATGTTTDAVTDFTGTNFFGKAQLIARLQGPYNATTHLMSTTLPNDPDIEPLMLTSPYADAPASVADIPAGVTDWVKLELRDTGNPATVLGKASAFVKNDGTIVGLDGISLPIIKNGNPVSIVSVFHRSHLAIRTPNAGINVTSPSLYDFSDNLANAYDNPANNTNDAMKLMSDGNYVMWAGNGNSNANSRFLGPSNDRDVLLSFLGGITTGVVNNAYHPTDYNMNGVVRFLGPANDRDVLLGQVLGGVTTAVVTQHH